MTISRRTMVVGLGAAALTGCSTTKFRTYSGPPVTRIQVFKARRTMQLLSGTRQLKSYKFELGFAPAGHKSFEGDGRTPEGAYLINRRNPNSRYHLSLGISYPNRNDIAYARSHGLSPGGDIFIHGTPNPLSNEDDWTWGCIAVTNDEIEEIYAMVRDGTPIYIYP
ncbi:L,D-transpeptidase family protein [Rhodobacteraceae bacterium S2214]|nr:L,D-transpeptidase family protein [Rhodobacteraceae bacterium S2214]